MTRSVEIPPEVVEKAAHAMYADNEVGEWEDGDLDTLLQYRRAARIALAAAALPYLAPAGDGGLREALEKLAGDWTLGVTAVGPARLRDLLAAHPAAPAVPQPVDREALVKAIAGPNDNWLTRHQAEVTADRVLALLAGEQEQVESPE